MWEAPAAPPFADLDGDGDLDAFIGEYNGNALFFQNTGSGTAPAFAAASTNPFGLADVGVRNGPAFADLDGDGDLDAFIGENLGSTVFFENTGCGNGGLDAGEACDDGNTANGDCCTAICQFEPAGSNCPGGLCNGVGACVPATPTGTAPAPTIGHSALAVLGGLLSLLGFRRLRRPRRTA